MGEHRRETLRFVSEFNRITADRDMLEKVLANPAVI